MLATSSPGAPSEEAGFCPMPAGSAEAEDPDADVEEGEGNQEGGFFPMPSGYIMLASLSFFWA